MCAEGALRPSRCASRGPATAASRASSPPVRSHSLLSPGQAEWLACSHSKSNCGFPCVNSDHCIPGSAVNTHSREGVVAHTIFSYSRYSKGEHLVNGRTATAQTRPFLALKRRADSLCKARKQGHTCPRHRRAGLRSMAGYVPVPHVQPPGPPVPRPLLQLPFRHCSAHT